MLKHKSLPKLFQNIIHDDTKQRLGTQRPNVYSCGNIVMTRLHALRLSEPSYLTLVIKKKPLNPVKLQCFKSIQLFSVKLKRNGKSSGYPYLNFLREKGLFSIISWIDNGNWPLCRVWKLMFQALPLSQREGLMLSFQALHGGQFKLSTQLITLIHLAILSHWQHHSFFKNLPPLFICVPKVWYFLWIAHHWKLFTSSNLGLLNKNFS